MRWFLAFLVVLVVGIRLTTGINGEGGGVTEIAWERSLIDFSHLVVFGFIGASAALWWSGYQAKRGTPEFVDFWEMRSTIRRACRWLAGLAFGLTVFEGAVAKLGRVYEPFAVLLMQWNLLER